MSDRMYEPQGFTDQILEALRFHKLLTRQAGPDLQYFNEMPAEVLLALAEKLPEANLECRQNQGPPISACIELALVHPEARFHGYVTTRDRDDERFSIEGVWVPPELDVEATAIGGYLPADEDDVVDGRRRLWWD